MNRSSIKYSAKRKGDFIHPSFLSTVLVSILFFSVLYTGVLSAQSIKINEVMTKNGSVIFDEDGDASDWIEISNNGVSEVALEGYALTTDIADIDPWLFPSLSLSPDSYYLLFASNKDRTAIVNHWETIIDWGDIWKYKAGASNIPSTWYTNGYSDIGWSSGFSGFGYGDGDDATNVSDANSIFIRKTFNLDSVQDVTAALLHVDYDDGFLAYLNGVEIARAFLGVEGEEVSFDEFSTGSHEAQIYQGGKPETFLIPGLDTLLILGNNVLAVQVHNVSGTSSDLSLIPFLTLGYTNEPPGAAGKPDILDVPELFLHTDFRLSASGESLYLLDPAKQLVDSVLIPALPEDISYGRQPDGSSNLLMFTTPTPSAPNVTQGFTEKLPPPEFVNAGRFYDSQVFIGISGDPLADIYYSLDGTPPSSSSLLYSGPIQINETKVVRAAAIKTGSIPSDIISETFFVNENTQLDIVSIITDPDNLWDYDEGMYVKGPNAESNFPYFGANFWQDWEKGVHLEFYEQDRTLAFEQDCGMKIYGGWSRGHAQKSLSIFARNKYGSNEFSYKLFPDVDSDEYHSFILRNSGNDWNVSMMRDAFLHTLVKDLNMEKQAYRPVVVMLNGEYWGIHNLREKINEEYLAQHHDVDPDEVDMLQNNAEVIEGNNQEYVALIEYINTHNLSVDEYYLNVETQVDVNNFINYYNFQIYLNNQDWPGNNIKFWKGHSDNSKWRWILFDTDFGFGIWDVTDFEDNTLEFALDEFGDPWPNPPWSTFLARNLLKNNGFKNKFLNNFADLSNSIFHVDNVVAVLDSLEGNIDNEMSRHISKWGTFTKQQWIYRINVMRSFANNRLPRLRIFYLQHFGISGYAKVNIVNETPEIGTVKINSLELKENNWSGHYFNGIPVKLIAVPKFGYKFSGWEGDVNSSEDTLIYSPTTSFNITARFEKDNSKSKIVINEINYNSSPTLDTKDWFEIYNNSSENINLNGWYFKDEQVDNVFQFVNTAPIEPGEYFIICRDNIEFKTFFPGVENVIGNFDFGLSNGGDIIRLFNSNGELMDSVNYDDDAPWDSLADGSGRTLSLTNTNLDNNNFNNWKASGLNGGTPGEQNDVFIVSTEEEENIVTEFKLEQNYPNPFNPTTTIKYSIPVNSRQYTVGRKKLQSFNHSINQSNSNLVFVQLNVYDMLGREVAILVDKHQRPGVYQIEFNANGLSSGVYFYTLQAGKFLESKKMLMIK